MLYHTPPPFHSGTAAPSSRPTTARRDCERASFRPAGAGHRQPVSTGRSYCSDWWADYHMQTGTESTARVQRRPQQTPLLIQRPPPCPSIGECSAAAGRQRIEAERLSPMKDIAPLDAGRGAKPVYSITRSFPPLLQKILYGRNATASCAAASTSEKRNTYNDLFRYLRIWYMKSGEINKAPTTAANR